MRRLYIMGFLFFVLCDLSSRVVDDEAGWVGLCGAELKTAVSKGMRSHEVLEYETLWACFEWTDRMENGVIRDRYSSSINRTFDGLHREHVFPKSWWGGMQNEAYTDLHNIFPADAETNSVKRNLPLGWVGLAVFDNGVSKVGYNNAPLYSTTALVFEPSDAYKGDFARIYFYMVTCYEEYNWTNPDVLDSKNVLEFESWLIDVLLQWHRQDPVSAVEEARNERVYQLQKNRNAFVDFPQLIEYIWGRWPCKPYEFSSESQSEDLVTPAAGSELLWSVYDLGGCLRMKNVALDERRLWRHLPRGIYLVTNGVQVHRVCIP